MTSIPTRAQIESRQLEKLQVQVKEALSGERLASFLPIIRELSEEYDAHAIAAAALQITYDKTRPTWMQSEAGGAEEEKISSPKPVLLKRAQQPQQEQQLPSVSKNG